MTDRRATETETRSHLYSLACCALLIVGVIISSSASASASVPSEVLQFAEMHDCKFDSPSEQVGNKYLYHVLADEPGSFAISCIIGFRNYLLVKSKNLSCEKKVPLFSNTSGVLSTLNGEFTLREHEPGANRATLTAQAMLIKVSWGEDILEIGLYCHKGKWYSMQLSGEVH